MGLEGLVVRTAGSDLDDTALHQNVLDREGSQVSLRLVG